MRAYATNRQIFQGKHGERERQLLTSLHEVTKVEESRNHDAYEPRMTKTIPEISKKRREARLLLSQQVDQPSKNLYTLSLSHDFTPAEPDTERSAERAESAPKIPYNSASRRSRHPRTPTQPHGREMPAHGS